MEIIHNQGVCDPHIHIFNGKAYLFSSHDHSPDNKDYTMYDWQIFSSDDLLHWKKEYIFDPKDTFIGETAKCYAVDAAYRNGKYYLYFSRSIKYIGVAVSENGPAGPYRDALGKPLIPEWYVNTHCYDPTVFIDDDEQNTPYLIFGFTGCGKHYYIAKLNEDMISLAEEPKPIEIENGWEDDANWITKHGGKYYLNTHHGQYAVADSVYGPYTYRGIFCSDSYVDHATFFTFHNQTYVTYGLPQNAYGDKDKINWYYRTSKILYAHYRANGDIAIDEFIQDAGVGQYDAQWNEIRAVWFFDASDGVTKCEKTDGQFELLCAGNNSYVYYPNVRNLSENAIMTVRAANNGDNPCKLTVKENSPSGETLGFCLIPPSSDYKDIECRLDISQGEHGLCFVFEKNSRIKLDSFRFD